VDPTPCHQPSLLEPPVRPPWIRARFKPTSTQCTNLICPLGPRFKRNMSSMDLFIDRRSIDTAPQRQRYSIRLHRVKLRHSNLRSSYDPYVVGQHGALWWRWNSDEDLTHYSNKIESVSLRKCPYYHYITKKVNVRQQTFMRAQLPPTSWRDCLGITAGIDMVWRNYVPVSLCSL